MTTIKTLNKEHQDKIDRIDRFELDLIIADVISKPREFVIAHPEFVISKAQKAKIKKLVEKRQTGVPLAYLIGKKEFFGLEFQVNRNVLIPRPETEILIEEALKIIQGTRKKEQETRIIDIGTGSGNIIISIAYNIKRGTNNGKISYFATDISSRALMIAKLNSKKYKLDKKIKFLKGNLMEPFFKNTRYKIQDTRYIMIANLPYVSHENYKKYLSGIKFEPKSALVSKNCGLFHYEKLFKQFKILHTRYKIQNTVIIEFSPEQKNKIYRMIKNYFLDAKIIFKKDLAGKWRLGIINF